LKESQLYTWRQKRRLEGLTTEEQKLQHGELARLKRDLARLEEENAWRAQILSATFMGDNVAWEKSTGS
jgi:transposase-like protein